MDVLERPAAPRRRPWRRPFAWGVALTMLGIGLWAGWIPPPIRLDGYESMAGVVLAACGVAIALRADEGPASPWGGTPRLEVSADALRWSHGWRQRRRQRFERDAVGGARWVERDGKTWLALVTARGQQVGSLPLLGLDRSDVAASLARHGWPAPDAVGVDPGPVGDAGDQVAGGAPTDVLRAGTIDFKLDHRMPGVFLLGAAGFFAYLGVAYGGPFGRLGAGWFGPSVAVVAGVLLAFGLRGLRRPLPVAVLEIDDHEVRFTDAKGAWRSLPRAVIASAGITHRGGNLVFRDAAEVGVDAVRHQWFGEGAVYAALTRHGWPVPRRSSLTVTTPPPVERDGAGRGPRRLVWRLPTSSRRPAQPGRPGGGLSSPSPPVPPRAPAGRKAAIRRE